MAGNRLLKTKRSFCYSLKPQTENGDSHVVPISALLGPELSYPKKSIREMTSLRDLKVVSNPRRAVSPPEGHFEQASSSSGRNSSNSNRSTSKTFATLSHVIHWIRDPKKNNAKKQIPEEAKRSLTACNFSRNPSRTRSDTLASRRSPVIGVRPKDERRPKDRGRQSQVNDIESHASGFKSDDRVSSYDHDTMFRERIPPSRNYNTEDKLEISCRFQSYEQDPDNRSSFETLDNNTEIGLGDDTIQLPKWPDCFDSWSTTSLPPL
ncbi:hypothetical protein DFH28DRAFT_956008 [Melampsora americana]|nr:hypothetical protein DFH28DRAFT_956008 [Melampsora americana]